MKLVERRSLNYSIILHTAAVFVFLVGIPVLLPSPPDPAPLVMSVEVLPISEISNVKPSDKPIQKEQNAPAKPVKTPPTPPPPQPAQPEKPKEATPPKPEPKPEPKPFDPMEGAEPVKDKKPPEKEKPTTESDFDKLMKDMQKQDAKPLDKTPAKAAPAATPGKDKTTAEENKTKSDAPYDASLPLSISEKDSIRSQFIPCWRAPIGSKDAASLAVRVKVELNPDATVKTAVVASDQQSRYNSDTFFRAAADAAVRAVHKCSPLKNLPADKFGGKEGWGTMEINFDPRDMV